MSTLQTHTLKEHGHLLSHFSLPLEYRVVPL